MALRAVFLVLAFVLVVTTRVSTAEEQPFMEAAYAKSPALPPRIAPAPAPAPVVHLLPPVPESECPRLCTGRCKVHSRPNHCQRVCKTCCTRCKCVPPGTYGNKEMCGKCYTDMTTHGGKLKCP